MEEFNQESTPQQSGPTPFSAPASSPTSHPATPPAAPTPSHPAASAPGNPAAAGALFGPMYGETPPSQQTAAKSPTATPPAPQAAIPPDDMKPQQVSAATAWATQARLDPGAIRQLQEAVGAAPSGHYDEATVHAVYRRQRQWQPRGAVSGAGQANAAVFQHLGLIYTHEIQNANVSDAMLKQIEQRYPGGVTVAIYADLKNHTANNLEFGAQARIFAQNHQSVGLSGGGVALGIPIPIKEIGDVLGAVQGIHRGLLAMHQKGQPPGTPAATATPPFTQVKTLELFCHGEPWGMGMNENNDFSAGGLHNTQRGVNPSNVHSFVKGLSGAVTPDVRVSLFACSTGRDDHKETYGDWQDHKPGQREGSHSMAASLSQELGPQASVWAHTTAGHTTENFAARVFGADAGGANPQGGLQSFEVLYPDSFVLSEVARLYPNAPAAQRQQLHDSLREQMWAHYQDSITGEHARAPSAKRYPVPMGQEMFSNPDHARALMQADWRTHWAPAHVRPAH